jgi:hypothetical protein
MWTTISVYVALVLIAVVLYFLTRNTTKAGGTFNFWDWIKRGAMRAAPSTPMGQRRLAAATTGDEMDVVTVLEDLYREFQEESAQLRTTMEAKIRELETAHQQTLQAVREELADLRVIVQFRDIESRMQEEALPAIEPEQDHVGAAVPGKDEQEQAPVALYFRILDELQQGKRPQDVATALDVNIDEVERVIRFMSAP